MSTPDRPKVAEALAATHPHLREFGVFLDELNSETARGAALTVAAMLDAQLGQIIAAFMVSGKEAAPLLEGFNAPLGTLSARIAAASAMGLISVSEYAEAEILRKVRNEFAHGVQVSFETQKVVGLCRRLTMDAKPYGDLKWNARSAFTTAAVGLILNLSNRAVYVSRQRLKRLDWPI